MSGTIYGADEAIVTAFNKTYALSLDPEVRALYQRRVEGDPTETPGIRITHPADIKAAALDLAGKGKAFIGDIIALGSDPHGWFESRWNMGFRFYPSMLQDAPHNVDGWNDPSNRPPGSLRVSIDLADFPAFIDPTAVAPPPPSVIGNQIPGFFIGGKQAYAAGVITGVPISDQPHFDEGYKYTLSSGVKSINGQPLPSGDYFYHVLNPGVVDALERIAVWLK